MADTVIEAHPTSISIEEIDFTDDLPNDLTITATATATDSAGNGASSIIASVTVIDMVVEVKLSGMEDGEDYLITVVAVGVDTALEAVKVIELRARSNQGPF